MIPPLLKPCEAKETADKGLEIWDDMCKSLNIKHFLVGGTCLGFYRDGGYIKGDGDVDTGIILSSHDDVTKLLEKLKEKGFDGGYGRDDEVGRVLFDILYGFNEANLKFLKSFDTVTYNGREYNVPHPVEEFLTLHYGNWKTRGGTHARRLASYHAVMVFPKV